MPAASKLLQTLHRCMRLAAWADKLAALKLQSGTTPGAPPLKSPQPPRTRRDDDAVELAVHGGWWLRPGRPDPLSCCFLVRACRACALCWRPAEQERGRADGRAADSGGGGGGGRRAGGASPAACPRYHRRFRATLHWHSIKMQAGDAVGALHVRKEAGAAHLTGCEQSAGL